MIITCPNCNSEYDILKTALGDKGREVKCAKCKETWLARPDGDSESGKNDISAPLDDLPAQDEIQEEQGTTLDKLGKLLEVEVETEKDEVQKNTAPKDEEAVDIPDAVKPPTDREEVASLSTPKSLPEKMAGYCLALLLFGALIVAVFINQNKVITAWPPAALFYEMAGSPVQFKGEGLIVESLSATILNNKKNQEVLIVKGRVVNLTADAIDVPKIQARLRSLEGRNIEQWIIDAAVERVEAGESFAFTSEYPNVPADVGSVNLMFIPILK